MICLPMRGMGRQSALAPGRRVEVGVLPLHPGDELRDLRMRAEGVRGRIAAGEFGVAEGRVDDAVAYRVDRHRLPAAAALRHRMVPLDLGAERAAAQEAGLRYLLNQWTLAK